MDEPTDPPAGHELGPVGANDLLPELGPPRQSDHRVLATEARELAIVVTRDQSESLGRESQQAGADEIGYGPPRRGLFGGRGARGVDPVRLAAGRCGVEELAAFVKPQPLEAECVGVLANAPAVPTSAFVLVHARNVALPFVSVR